MDSAGAWRVRFLQICSLRDEIFCQHPPFLALQQEATACAVQYSMVVQSIICTEHIQYSSCALKSDVDTKKANDVLRAMTISCATMRRTKP